MELQKRKYKRQEVIAMMDAYKSFYENKIAELKTKILELAKEKTALAAECENLREKEALIVSTLERAEKTSSELKERAELQYSLEIERIRRFSEKWDSYFKDLREKYPLYSTTKKAVEIRDKVVKTDKNTNPKKVIEELDALIEDKKENFNPKKKIHDYIAATGDNGFNLDEVLNPGKLQLEDLCKELGLLEDGD